MLQRKAAPFTGRERRTPLEQLSACWQSGVPRLWSSNSAPCAVLASLLKEWPPDPQRWHPSVLGAANWTPGKKEAFSGHKGPS